MSEESSQDLQLNHCFHEENAGRIEPSWLLLGHLLCFRKTQFFQGGCYFLFGWLTSTKCEMTSCECLELRLTHQLLTCFNMRLFYFNILPVWLFRNSSSCAPLVLCFYGVLKKGVHAKFLDWLWSTGLLGFCGLLSDVMLHLQSKAHPLTTDLRSPQTYFINNCM